MELVSSRDEFPFLKKFIRSLSLLSRISSLTLSPLFSLLSPMWQKLPYICNDFFYYNKLSITFLNYCTIEKSPTNLTLDSSLKLGIPTSVLALVRLNCQNINFVWVNSISCVLV